MTLQNWIDNQFNGVIDDNWVETEDAVLENLQSELGYSELKAKEIMRLWADGKLYDVDIDNHGTSLIESDMEHCRKAERETGYQYNLD
jgi:hypothetical protein